MTKYEAPFSPERLAVIRTAINHVDFPSGVNSAYLAGSHTAGLDTPTSDIDLYVLVDGRSVEVDVRQILVDGDRIDVETYGLEQATAYVDTVLTWAASADDLSALRRPDDEVDFVVRLLYCTPVKVSEDLRLLIDRLKKNEHVIRRLLVARWSLEAATLYEDFRGVVAQGEFVSAGIAGAAIFTAACKALCASDGDLYFGRKWVAKQLSRTSLPATPVRRLERYLLGVWAATGERPRREVTAFVDLLQTTLSIAQLEGWRDDRPPLNWIPWAGAGGLRHPLFLPIRLSDKVLLTNERQHQLLVSPGVAALWGIGPVTTASGVPESVFAGDRQDAIRRDLTHRGLFTAEPLGLPSE